LDTEHGVLCAADHGQEQMIVALAHATMERFSSYSSSKTWYFPCKGHM
jgi:hypothetical protein